MVKGSHTPSSSRSICCGTAAARRTAICANLSKRRTVTRDDGTTRGRVGTAVPAEVQRSPADGLDQQIGHGSTVEMSWYWTRRQNFGAPDGDGGWTGHDCTSSGYRGFHLEEGLDSICLV